MSATIRAKQAQLINAFTRERPWKQILLTAGVFVALMLFVAVYYKQTFVGLTDRHSMDIAQVARNVYAGRGFTTNFIRPMNVALLSEQNVYNLELNTAPGFVIAVAAMFKLRSPSDQCVAWVSVLFCLGAIGATYLLGCRLFNWRTGLLAAAAFATSEAVLQAARSGTEWSMAAFVFTLLLLTVVSHHRSTAKVNRSGVMYAAAAAVMLAVLYMTHHVLLFLAIPLTIYFGVTGRQRRLHLGVFIIVGLLAAAPWAYRNAVAAHGSVFGANAWDMLARTLVFPGDELYRSTDQSNLSLSKVVLFPLDNFPAFAEKLLTGAQVVGRSLTAVLGCVFLPFALVSMLYRFKAPAANAVRALLYGSIAILLTVFALFSVNNHAVVLFAPAIAVYGAGYLLLLLEAKKLHPIYARVVIGAAVALTCLPALSTTIWKSDFGEQSKALESSIVLTDSFDKIMYTDIPWAIAWRTSGIGVWLPLRDQDVYELAAKSLPLNYAIMTNESNTYSRMDTWHLLHRYQFWRDYLKDPDAPATKAQLASIAIQPGLSVDFVEREIREQKRQLPIFNSISGCSVERFKGLGPDEVVILSCVPR